MDSKEIEQKFDAMYMAIINGNISAARSVFAFSIQLKIDEKLDLLVNYLEGKGRSCAVEDIQQFRKDHLL